MQCCHSHRVLRVQARRIVNGELTLATGATDPNKGLARFALGFQIKQKIEKER